MDKMIYEWFKKGDNDILNVENNLKAEVYPADTVCFHCHQAAEKYLKGFLSFHNKPVEKTHNLLFLHQMCLNICHEFNTIREELLNLNNYSASIRYPDFRHEITKEEAEEAYKQALIVRSFILNKI